MLGRHARDPRTLLYRLAGELGPIPLGSLAPVLWLCALLVLLRVALGADDAPAPDPGERPRLAA